MRKNVLHILLEDKDIIVVQKPTGVATQNHRTGTADMVSLVKNHLYKEAKQKDGIKKEPYLGLIHRLDQPVSGILVFAKTPAAAKELSKQLITNGFAKYYKALLTHCPPKDRDTLVDYMIQNRQTNSSSICDSHTLGAKKAVLHYEVVEPTTTDTNLFHACHISDISNYTLVKIHLETGRHHQIRLQMASMGCPIYGDSKYAPSTPVSSAALPLQNRRSGRTSHSIALCAYQLSFYHPVTKQKLTFHYE